MKTEKLTFGPIPSRRLGFSLGINNIKGEKKCPYSCVYCQVGAKCSMTMQRQEFFTVQELTSSVEEHLESLHGSSMPDVLAFVPNGEPTLDVNLGRHIEALKRFNIPVAVISNGTLLSDPSVRNDLMGASWVSVKVDAGSDAVWRKHNRPVKILSYDTYLKGISIFAREFKGTLVTETMMCKGTNDSSDNIDRVVNIVRELNPQTAYITVPTRPPAKVGITAPDDNELLYAYNRFTSAGLNAELLTGFEGDGVGQTGNVTEDILNITAVHPLRKETILKMLREKNVEFAVIEAMVAKGQLSILQFDGLDYFLRKS